MLEHDREADEVLSEAVELEQEEQEVKNDVRLEADEDEKQPKKSKGKKKRGKKSRGHLHEAEGKDNAGGFEEAAQGKDDAAAGFEDEAQGNDDAAGFEKEAQGKDDAAGCGDGDHAAPKLKGVKRRLEFDKCEEAGDELWPGVEAVPFAIKEMSWVPVCTICIYIYTHIYIVNTYIIYIYTHV